MHRFIKTLSFCLIVLTLREMDLKSPLVQKQLKERYGNAIPYQEKIISPQALYESVLLQTVQY